MIFSINYVLITSCKLSSLKLLRLTSNKPLTHKRHPPPPIRDPFVNGDRDSFELISVIAFLLLVNFPRIAENLSERPESLSLRASAILRNRKIKLTSIAYELRLSIGIPSTWQSSASKTSEIVTKVYKHREKTATKAVYFHH